MKTVKTRIAPCLFLPLALLALAACDSPVAEQATQIGDQEPPIGDQAEEATDNSLWFGGEQYHFAWAAEPPTIGQEYVRGGETVESWTQMLTFAVVEGLFDEVVSSYLERRRPAMASEPDIQVASDSPYIEDIILRLVLRVPDGPGAELVLARVVANPGEPVRTLVFSKMLASADESDSGPILAKMDEWTAELASFSL